MPRARLPYVELNPNRHGRMRFYFRKTRDDARVRLPDTYLSSEFMVAYQACLAGQPAPVQATARRVSRGTLGWLIHLYQQSPEFVAYRPATKRPRISMLSKLADEKGGVDIEDINRAVIAEAVKARAETPDMANSWLTTVSNMFEWATKEVLPGDPAPIMEENPCEFVKRLVKARSDDLDEEDGHPTWSDEDLAKFEAAYPHGTRQRLIYEVLLCTGLRVGDAARVGRQHLKGDVISLKTEKTNTPITLRMLPRLERALALGPKGLDTELAWITGKNGRRMQKGYMGDFLSNAAKAVGLDRSGHGLRKAAARRYVEAGAKTHQLMAIFGWKTVAMVDKYTRMFDRKKAALGAMDDFVLDSVFSPTPVLGEGETA